MRLAAGLLLVVALSQSPPQPASGVWPPAGVLTEKDGATRPEAVTKVEPAYTREAMRARIQGFVTLQFVVEIDGSVGPVRVITPLDPVNGLDAAAVAALKQWHFKPATKDKVPVRALSTLVQMFGLNGLPPPMTLPAGFDAAPASSASTWAHEGVPIDGVLMDFSYPIGWARHASQTIAIFAVDPKSFHSVGVYRPATLPAPIPFPMSISQLARFSETMRIQFSRGGNGVETVAVGQSTLGSVNWLWLEMEAPTLSLQSAPSDVAAAMQDMVDGVHLWAFSTTVGSRLVQVLCAAPNLKGTTPADREAGLATARSECSGTLKRMSLTAR